MNFNSLKEHYEGKRVFVTGHTGFKGAWLSSILCMAGAEVYGYSLEPPTEPSLFELLHLERQMSSVIGDIRDYDALLQAMKDASPDFVFHLAAQPIVRTSYQNPRETYETNVMGTVNLLECVQHISGIRGVLNVTTDKVYENDDIFDHAFTEDEKLDGYDPYSNSKSCSELVTHAYYKSFFRSADAPAISTARAGNVIGGGDFSKDRIIPDCVRASVNGDVIHVRNPYSTRPYQHVLEPLGIYLTIMAMQAKDKTCAGYYNVGPDDMDCASTERLVNLFVKYWGDSARWESHADKDAPHEAQYLKLDCSKIKKVFGWTPTWHIEEAVEKTVEWYKAWSAERDLYSITQKQIMSFY